MEKAVDLPATGRDKAIDGWRAVAASLVVFAHAISYRFGEPDFPAVHLIRRFADPLAELGVQVFFVISGFIITSLLIRERGKTGQVSIAAFYIRRSCRILPPLAVYYVAVVGLSGIGKIDLQPASFLSSVTFTCNVGFVDCQWWVAHTWSLAVEEQFYLFWPLLFSLIMPSWRVRILTATVIVCIAGKMMTGPTFHSNFSSFGCIAAGALFASSQSIRERLERASHYVAWLVVAGALIVGPLLGFTQAVSWFLPVLIVYLVFAANNLAWIRGVLVLPPFQWVGLASYSLYLWQQVFLAKPGMYAGAPLPIVLLPIAVVASVVLVERPFIRLGHRLSRTATHPAAPMSTAAGDAV